MFAATLALAASLSASPVQDMTELSYAELADRFRETHGLGDATPEEVEIPALLENSFFMTRVGQFEVWIPIHTLEEKETAKDYQGVCAALCQAQEQWIDWLGERVEHRDERLKEFATHRKWIEKWKPAKLYKLGADEPHNALELFGAKDEGKELSSHLAQVMQSSSILGNSMEMATPSRLVLMPNRKEFVEFVAFAGWLLPEQQPNFWVSGIQNWTEFRVNDLQVIALQYPATAPLPGDYEGSTSMKDRDITGLEQQVVQMGFNQLLAYQHGDAMPSEVISGLSISLLIEMYGTCHTRNDGDMRGRQTQAREVFVAGGQSEGGRLPQNIASSRWRTEYGKYYYARILKQVQKSGASSDKRNRHKYNSFLLIGDNESDRFIAHAPIFGPKTGEPEVPPPGVDGDYMEFLRAYNVAFLHWLRTDAISSKKKSAEAFSNLLMEISKAETDVSLSSLMNTIYGMPLSNEKVDTKCLEGRFLKWISQQ